MVCFVLIEKTAVAEIAYCAFKLDKSDNSGSVLSCSLFYPLFRYLHI